MKFLRILPLLILFIFTGTEKVHAQIDDVGFWSQMTVAYHPVKKLALEITEEYRLEDHLSKIDLFRTRFAVDYQFNKYIALRSAYSLFQTYVADEWGFYQRVETEATGSLPIGNFTISLRERYMCYFYSDHDPVMYLRSRLKLAYQIGKTGLTPAISAEIHNYLNGDHDISTAKIYYRADLAYTFCGKHTFTLYSFLNVKNNDTWSDSQNLVLGVNYKYTIK